MQWIILSTSKVIKLVPAVHGFMFVYVGVGCGIIYLVGLRFLSVWLFFGSICFYFCFCLFIFFTACTGAQSLLLALLFTSGTRAIVHQVQCLPCIQLIWAQSLSTLIVIHGCRASIKPWAQPNVTPPKKNHS